MLTKNRNQSQILTMSEPQVTLTKMPNKRNPSIQIILIMLMS